MPGGNRTLHAPRSGRFRPEVEGIRAVAAAMVTIYHVFLGRVSGGVDVFFVVAGFLTTVTLTGHLHRFGRPRAGVYFSRLFSRLLPLALLVLATTWAAVAVWTPPWRRPGWWDQIVTAATYRENWKLISESVEYLAKGEPQSPVQHFWALSIQGQFYAAWFLLAAGAVWLGRRNPLRVLRWVVATVVVASFATSVWWTAVDQPVAYFHTGTRAWEFGIGSLVALWIDRWPTLGRRTGWLAGWVGVAMVVSCGLLFAVSISFPGWVAAWPVAGAVLVILGGNSAAAGVVTSSTSLLGTRPLVWLGGVSYGLYLWHWPILTFWRAYAGPNVAVLPGVTIIAGSLVLSWITTRLVETPVRQVLPQRLQPWPLIAAGTLAVAVVVTPAAVAADRPVTQTIGTNRISVHTHPGALADDDVTTTSFAPDLLTAVKDQSPTYANGCHQTKTASAVVRCVAGDRDADTTIVLIGGSHAAHYFPALQRVAEEHGWRLVNFTKSMCRFTAGPYESGRMGESCAEWNDRVLDELIELHPDLVFTTSTVSDETGETVPAGYVDRWRRLEKAGITVFAVRDTPRWESSPLDCVWANRAEPTRCQVERARTLADRNPVETLEDPPGNVTFADLTDVFCDEDLCSQVIGNVLVYYDTDHMTATFSRTLAPLLAQRLELLLTAPR